MTYTVPELARRWRIGRTKVLAWIRGGHLPALNLAASTVGRPRWRVSAEAVAEFERRRSGTPTPRVRKRRQATEVIEFF